MCKQNEGNEPMTERAVIESKLNHYEIMLAAYKVSDPSYARAYWSPMVRRLRKQLKEMTNA